MGNVISRLGRAAVLLAGAAGIYFAGTVGAGCGTAGADTGEACECEPLEPTVVTEQCSTQHVVLGVERAYAVYKPKDASIADMRGIQAWGLIGNAADVNAPDGYTEASAPVILQEGQAAVYCGDVGEALFTFTSVKFRVPAK